jgi:hypothetical protein
MSAIRSASSATGLRIGEALADHLRGRINHGKTLG